LITALHHPKPVLLHQADFRKESVPKLALWLGSESQGMTEQGLAACEFAVH